MATTTQATQGSSERNEDIAIITADNPDIAQAMRDGHIEPATHVERNRFDWAQPKQSWFCCTFYSVLCILCGIIIVLTNNPTYDQDYNDPAQLWVTPYIVVNVTEWQFNKELVKPSDRMVPELVVYLVSTLVPFIGAFLCNLYLYAKSTIFHTKEWILDEIISFIKGFCILFFLCYGMVAFVSARISLPKATAYDICDYDVEIQDCTKKDDATLENAWSSFPNAQMTFLIASLFFFSLYLCNKILMIINVRFQEKYKQDLSETRGIIHYSSESQSVTQGMESSQRESMGSQENEVVSPQSTESMLNENTNNNSKSNLNTSNFNKSKSANYSFQSESAIDQVNGMAAQETENLSNDTNNTNNTNNGNSSANSSNANNVNNNETNSANNNRNGNNNSQNSSNNSNNNNNGSANDSSASMNSNNLRITVKGRDFGTHRLLSVYVIILLIFGFIPTYLALFICITFIHDHVAYVWDFLGSCVIGVIMTWFTYNMFWDSPFDTMELGYTFELSGIPRNSYYYDELVKKLRRKATIFVTGKPDGLNGINALTKVSTADNNGVNLANYKNNGNNGNNGNNKEQLSAVSEQNGDGSNNGTLNEENIINNKSESNGNESENDNATTPHDQGRNDNIDNEPMQSSNNSDESTQPLTK